MRKRKPIPNECGPAESDGRGAAASNNAAEGAARVTLADIARHCGVARMTVSYALRGERKFVSATNIARIQAAARQMGYNPALSHAARRLRYQRQGTAVTNHLTAVFFPVARLQEPYWAIIYQGVQTELLAHRYGVLSCSVDVKEPDFEAQLPHVFQRGDVDGAIVFPTEEYREKMVDDLMSTVGFEHRPVVTVIEVLENCSAAVADDCEIGHLAAGHLLDLGHRHLIAFESSRFTTDLVRARHRGYRQAYRERGLESDGFLHINEWIWEHTIDLPTAALEMLAKFPQATGVLTPGDGMGIQLARALHRSGWRIPQDLSLIGVDDCGEWLDAKGENIWTTVRVPLLELGRTAARLLIKRVDSPDRPVECRKLPVELVVRGTTAPPKSTSRPSS